VHFNGILTRVFHTVEMYSKGSVVVINVMSHADWT